MPEFVDICMTAISIWLFSVIKAKLLTVSGMVIDKKFETTGITGHVLHDFSFIPLIENTFFLVCSLHKILSKLVFHKGLF